MLSFFSISPHTAATRSRNPFRLLPEDVLGRQADNPRTRGLQGVKAPRRKVSARHAVEIEIQMRPRGYSNSVRQPLFCISGPTQLPSGTQIIYIAFSILSLPPFSVSLSLSPSARSVVLLPSLFSSFAKRTFFDTAFAYDQQSRFDNRIQIRRCIQGLPGPGLNSECREFTNYVMNYTVA